MTKKELRREMLALRKSLTPAERESLSAQIVQKFLALEIYQDASTVMAYVSMAEEIQLREIFADAFAQGKTLAVPLIVGRGEMLPVIVPNFDALETGAFGIATVKENLREFVSAEKIECVVVPGAAFDAKCNRLGLGGGYYDKFLPAAVNAKKIALAYDFQIVEEIPVEPHDSPVDMIITEKRIIERV